MKKRIFTIAAAAALVMSVALTSCSKSNSSLINDYRKLSTELVEAYSKNDTQKIEKLSKDLEKLGKELEARELTKEEKEEILKISFDATGALLNNLPEVGDVDLEDLDIEAE